MTQDTRAETLRILMANEDEYSSIPLLVPGTGIEGAVKIFLERLHAHEVRIGKYHTDCYMCKTADEMIKEFK
jgi:hypothetical protein